MFSQTLITYKSQLSFLLKAQYVGFRTNWQKQKKNINCLISIIVFQMFQLGLIMKDPHYWQQFIGIEHNVTGFFPLDHRNKTNKLTC